MGGARESDNRIPDEFWSDTMPTLSDGTRRIPPVLAAWIGIAAACSPASAQDWEGSVFAQWCDSVCQSPDETWRTIPWQTDLLAAQRLAVAESKPLFIWAMDGHPLGCT
jgi:hypothetical protein